MATEEPPASEDPARETDRVGHVQKVLHKKRLRRRLLFLLGVLFVLLLTKFFLDFLGFKFAQLTSDRAQEQFPKFVGGLLPPNFVDLTTHTKQNNITGLRAIGASLAAWGWRSVGLFGPIEVPLFVPIHVWDTIAGAQAGYGSVLLSAAVTTVAAGFTGTVMGFPLALFFGVLGSERVTPFPFNFIFRGVMSTIRAIPAIIWTLVYIPIFGISPATGVLAITTDTIGNLGRLFTDELEEIEDGPIEAIESTGASRSQAVIFGMLSQVRNSFIAWTMYIFEINTRIAITLGVLGVGGLGMYIDNKIGQFAFPEAMAGICVVIVIVLSIEFTSSRVRARLRPGSDEGSGGLLAALADLVNPRKWLGTGVQPPEPKNDNEVFDEDDDPEVREDGGIEVPGVDDDE